MKPQAYLSCWAFSQFDLTVPEPPEDDFPTLVSSPAEQVPLACSMIAFLLKHMQYYLSERTGFILRS